MTTPHPLSAAALFSLKDWVAVVTGGGTGVGLMIAQTLAANGARVYITGRRADVLETSARTHGSRERLGPGGGAIVPVVMDVTSKESIKNAVAEIGQKEGCLNLLVNNAGVWIDRVRAKAQDGPEAFGEAMFAEDWEGNWQKTLNTNCTSNYFVTAAFLPLLAKAASGPTGRVGSVINNSSVGGFLRISQNCQFSYNISKGAFAHLTRQMAYELSHENINVRVNGIALGYFPSEMTTGVSNEANESPSPSPEQFAQTMARMGIHNVKRMGTPEELASLILMIATNEYMWGNIVIVDGGIALRAPGNL
ncbi:NAD(P)-binding protein [Hypoxylon sp. FL1284]|nr:NAD(P)-binding protein [Hypoxylon sp. FL1284]